MITLHFVFLPAAAPGAAEVRFSPEPFLKTERIISADKKKIYKAYYYDPNDFLPLLKYDHGNKAGLDKKLQDLISMLDNGSPDEGDGLSFMVYGSFVYNEIYRNLGPALILWLTIAIEQQRRRRRVQVTDSELKDWLSTSRTTVIKYKKVLAEFGLLNVDSSQKVQKMSVSFSFHKPQVQMLPVMCTPPVL